MWSGDTGAYLAAAVVLTPFWLLWLAVVRWRRPAAQLGQSDRDKLGSPTDPLALQESDLDELLQRDPELLEPHEESFLIAHAKEIEKERKRQTDLAWAERVIGGEESVESSSPSRQVIPRAVRHAV